MTRFFTCFGRRCATAAARLAAALMLLAGLSVATGPATAQTSEAEAKTAAQRLIDGAHAAPNFDALKQVIAAEFDFAFWERFMLGEDKLGMNDAQADVFRDLLPAYIARLYKNQLGGGGAGKPTLDASRVQRGDVFISATIPRSAGRPIPAQWRMRGADPKVVDIVVGGISFLVLKRSEFRAVAMREGVDEMLSRMRNISAGRR